MDTLKSLIVKFEAEREIRHLFHMSQHCINAPNMIMTHFIINIVHSEGGGGIYHKLWHVQVWLLFNPTNDIFL